MEEFLATPGSRFIDSHKAGFLQWHQAAPTDERGLGMRLDVTADELRDFLTFRRMITPLLIQALFWILSAIVMIIGVVLLIVGDGSGQRVAGFWMIFLGPLAVRVYLEIFMVAFRINETLTDIRANTMRE
jgi:hypothetical protein